MNAQRWHEIRDKGLSFSIIPPAKVAHPGAIDGDKILTLHRRTVNKTSRYTLSNHQRVMRGRAARMGISIQEYQKRFGG